MQTLYLPDVSEEQYQMVVRVLEAMNITVQKKPTEDDGKMTEAAFYQMIDEALESPIHPLTPEKRKEWFYPSTLSRIVSIP